MMRQTLHILRKDMSRASSFIVGMFVLWIGFVSANSQTVTGASAHLTVWSGIDAFVPVLLPLSIWFVMVHVVQEEPLPGDRQFWLTRPYGRYSLLAAKLLFVGLFVNLPLFVSDISILQVHHASALNNVPDLLARQVFVSFWLIVPLFTLATLTDTAALCGFYMTLTLLGLFLVGFLFTRFPLDKLPTPSSRAIALTLFLVLLTILAAVIVRQYHSRRTATNRLVSMLAMSCLGWPLLSFGFMTPPLAKLRSVNEPPPSLSLLPDELELLGPSGADTVVLKIPVQVDHLPSSSVLSANGSLTVSTMGRVLLKNRHLFRSLAPANRLKRSPGLLFPGSGQRRYSAVDRSATGHYESQR